MYIGYDEEQEALKAELRAYYEKLLTPEIRGGPRRGPRRRPGPAPGRAPDGRRRLARHRLADEYGGQGRSRDRAVHLLRRVDARRRAGADAHDQHRRPDDHALRHRRAEGLLPAEDPRRARSTSASATPSRAPAPTSPRSRPGPCATATSTSSTARRSSPASPATPTTAGSPSAPIPRPKKHKGISMFIVDDEHARHQGRAAATCCASTTSTRCSSTTSACPATALVGGENNGWRLITNQLNHERVTLCSSGMLERVVRRTSAAGRRRRSSPTAGA